MPQVGEAEVDRDTPPYIPETGAIRQAIDVIVAEEALRYCSDPGQELGTPFPFRILKKTVQAQQLVNIWLSDKSKIEDVAVHFGKTLSTNHRSHLAEWHLIRINTLARYGNLRGIARDKSHIAVLIALEKMNTENGLFLGPETRLSAGQGFAFKGSENITFPGTGGGTAVLLFLKF